MSLKVLYLDDEPDLCEIFSEEFASDDITVTTYTDAARAIGAVKSILPDLVFLDYRLPETNGDTVAQAMPASIPKYLITGESSVVTQYKFNGVFGKPLDRKGIHKVMADLLEIKKAG